MRRRSPVTPAELTVESLSASYGGSPALCEVSMHVAAGSVLAVLGPNGAGKTTLAGVIGGSVRPDGGTVRLDNADVTRLPAHRRAKHGVLHVPERGAPFPGLTVRENLRIAFEQAGTPGALGDAMQRAFDIFPRLADRRDTKAGVLSGGEQQMLALARPLTDPPRLLVVDELSLGLAPALVEALFEVVATLPGRTTLVLIEQYIERALAIADRVLVLARGRTEFDGLAADLTLAEVEAHYRLAGAHLGG